MLYVVGVVFNFVASESHYSFLRQACEDAGVEALGYLPKCADVEIPSRLLGLSLDEDFCFEEFADRVACLVEEHVDIDRLLAITALPERQPVPRVKEVMRTVSKANLNIAIARDPAFNFSYEENIHFLSTLGKITYFSPLRDDCLPEADFVYLPGGYPEFYLSELSMNSGMRESIHSFVEEKVYDLFIALDAGDKQRLGASAKYFDTAKRTVCIDHHISNPGYAQSNYIEAEASSTCELIYDILDEDKIGKNIAEALYMGIAHDTGVFQYTCTSSKTMQIAG